MEQRGTCGGFQHAVLEYARNVLGHAQADHAETTPDSVMPLIGRLSCSLVEKSGPVFFREGSQLRDIYRADQAEEQYHCNYGLNPAYAGLFDGSSGLRVAATDAAGEVRAVELVGHPFFVATLFQPERSGLRGTEHPLITAFLHSAAESIIQNSPRTSLSEWAEANAENWGDLLSSEDVEGFTRRGSEFRP